MPFPTPPPRRVLSAAETVAKRSGLTVLVVPRRGLVLWSVARTADSTVLGVRSGWIPVASAGPRCGKAYAEAVRAVTEMDPGRNEPVFSVVDTASELLLELGLHVDPSYPPGGGSGGYGKGSDR
ncbi:hypothetical protein ASG77_11745 [Arthrobacter sp. Soil762]|nr:hypothetical protein ASG77_11745 [Arthrobacter sp. Soil762]